MTTSIILYFFESTLLYVTHLALGLGGKVLVTRHPQLWNVQWPYPASYVLQISRIYLTVRQKNLFIMSQKAITPMKNTNWLSAKSSGKSR